MTERAMVCFFASLKFETVAVACRNAMRSLGLATSGLPGLQRSSRATPP